MVSQMMDLMDQRYVPEAAVPQYYLAGAELQLQAADPPGSMPNQEQPHPGGVSRAEAGAPAGADAGASTAEQQGGAGGSVQPFAGGIAGVDRAAGHVGAYHTEQRLTERQEQHLHRAYEGQIMPALPVVL